MITQVERIKNAFFSQDDHSVDNVKFFLGNARAVTAEKLAEQLERAEVQIRIGNAVKTKKLDGELTTKSF
jgi:hypothetical protein